MYRTSTGAWYVNGQPTGVTYGSGADVPAPADYSGDGKAAIAVYRPSTATWYVQGQAPVQLGSPGSDDVPVPADYNGDGRAEMAVYSPTTGTWTIQGQVVVVYGAAGDVPVQADFDGDGKADIAVYRPSTGMWFLRGATPEATQYGTGGDVPLPGDYDGDGDDDIAVYRASTGVWFLNDGVPELVPYGAAGDQPEPADYDGDGTTDIAVQRASSTWFVKGRPPVTFQYADGRGNRTASIPEAGAWSVYGYDLANRLTNADVPGSVSDGQQPSLQYIYGYNGDGLRMRKTTPTGTTPYTWDEVQGVLLSEGPVGSATRYVYGPEGLPLEQVSASQAVTYYHPDQLGSTRVLTSATGAVVATATYDAYGKIRASTGSVKQPFGFAGEYTDAETGFQYLRARYYDPGTGQFLSRDPIVDETRQPYSYSDNNPLNGTDPTGLAVAKLGPDPSATGPHTVFKTDPKTGRVTGYTEFDGSGNPVKRFRRSGRPHGGVEPPLILEPKPGKGPGAQPKVPRLPRPDERPREC